MADMETIYVRINWENSPSSATALGATNLNKMDLALSTIDGRVVSINTTKLDVATANTMVQNVTVDANGVFTITKLDGTVKTYDTKIEKIAVNFAYDEATQRLVLTLEDGTIQYVDLSSLVSDLDFTDSDTIDFTVTNGVVSAIVKNGSITSEKLQPDYLADVTVQAQNASNSASSALTSEQNASTSATMSRSYAVGDTATRPNEAEDNAKYYYEQAKSIVISGVIDDVIPSYVKTYSSNKIEEKLGIINGSIDTLSDTVDTNSQTVNTHISDKIYTDFGVHGIRYFNDKLEYYNGTDWVEIETGGGGTYSDVTNLLATSQNQGTEILLTWTNPVTSAYVSTEIYWSATTDLTNLTREQCEVSGTLISTTNESQSFTGLTVGTTRYFKVFVKYDAFGSTAYSNGVATSITTQDTTPPNPITNFTATGGNATVSLSWTNPTDSDFAGTRIVRQTSVYPTSITDGVTVYNNTGTTYEDTGLTNGTTYYYRAFPYDTSTNYNTTESGQEITATPVAFKIMTVNIDLANSNPSTCITYADDATTMTSGSSAWDAFFGHKPCLFKDGAVVVYLNPNDYTKDINGNAVDITSGSAGDVMVEFPRRGLKISTVGTTVTISMTDNPNDSNFEYNAHTRGTTAKDCFYLGAYKGYNLSSKLRSLSGKTPTATQTIGTFRTQAQANGAGYEQSGFYQLMFRQAMYLLKYKNLNSQVAVGRGFVDGNIAAIATGGTNANGMDFGKTIGNLQMKLFGLEDFWGNVWEWIDGIVTTSTRNMLTATTGFNDTGSGYTDQGQGATANIGGYMSKPQGSTKTGFLAKEVSGSETTYFCDSAYLHASCVACFGGSWNNASDAGAFRLGVNIAASTSGVAVAARLMFL